MMAKRCRSQLGQLNFMNDYARVKVNVTRLCGLNPHAQTEGLQSYSGRK